MNKLFKNNYEVNKSSPVKLSSHHLLAIEGMQKGRSSPVYNGGNFSPIMDTPTLMFHKWVATNLTR